MNETILIGAVLVVLVAAVTFYMVSRTSYLEKKVSLLENVLIDIKMALESMEQEEVHPAAAAVQPLPAAASVVAGAPLESSDSDEKFYSSVLAEAAEGEGLASTAEVEELLEESTESVAPEAEATESVQASSSNRVEPNYDSMTRSELVTIAEQRGLRVPKRLGRNEVIALLRKSDGSRNGASSTGTDNASAPSGALGGQLAAGTASMGGEFTVDLGQTDGAGAMEEATL